MKLAPFIALRYLRSPKSHSVINLITWVAGIAIAIPTAALVIILSLHNGLSSTIEGLYNSFDAQLRITPSEGKFFDPTQLNMTPAPEIAAMSYIIEDNVLLRKGDREHLATLRGVDSAYERVVPIRNLITHGSYEPQLGQLQQAVVGQGIAYNLGINPSLIQPIDIYAIRPDQGTTVLPTPIYRTQSITPVGIYTLDEQTDGRYIIVPLEFAQNLLGFAGKVSSVEIMLRPGIDPEKAQDLLKERLGSKFRVETRFEQKASLYRAINQEKWIVFLLLMMVQLIASLSLAGSIVVLVADKRSQMQTLRSMGATRELIRSIFRYEGMLIVVIGSVSGLVLGSGFALAQQHFGFIKMAGDSMIVDHYPVILSPLDLVGITLSVWILGWIISTLTTRATV